jgi:hypothetical protein
MNERIYELADRAGEYADFESGICTDEFLEKFAELLIKECANIDFRKKAFLSQDDDASVAKTILEHFGVE